jgi:hypothetical protein
MEIQSINYDYLIDAEARRCYYITLREPPLINLMNTIVTCTRNDPMFPSGATFYVYDVQGRNLLVEPRSTSLEYTPPLLGKSGITQLNNGLKYSPYYTDIVDPLSFPRQGYQQYAWRPNLQVQGPNRLIVL